MVNKRAANAHAFDLLPEEIKKRSECNTQQFNANTRERFEALPKAQQLQLKILAGLSDFIAMQLCRYKELLPELSAQTIGINPNYHSEIQQYVNAEQNQDEFFKALRKFRHTELAKIAAADMLGQISIASAIQYQSHLADALILMAYDWAVQQISNRFGLPLDKNEQPIPMQILAMGKLGGEELNFSSDIDLIFIYPCSGETKGGRKSLDHHEFYTKVGQKLIAALDQQTQDGQVFRVDMRLRPFGDSGPLVMSHAAIEDYYQEQGREWERYAMLKARVLGEPNKYSHALYALLQPFVFRRYIDFGVMESLRKMKRMIQQEVRRRGLANNIKLGAGGIREVEFIVQALQLIKGGREPKVQVKSLLKALPVLVEMGLILEDECLRLQSAYLQLRQWENYLQAFEDQQTQTLPDDTLNQSRLIYLCQAENWQAVLDKVQQITAQVSREFKWIIGDEAEQHVTDYEHFQLLWGLNKIEDKLDIQLPWLAGDDTESFIRSVHQFKAEMRKRSLGTRGRDVLDKMMPILLRSCETEEVSLAQWRSVSRVIGAIATRTAYLELLYENHGAMRQLVYLCAESEWLAEQLAKYPMLLDELIDPQYIHNPISPQEFASELRQHMLRVNEDDLELQMEVLRQYKQTQQLRIAASDLSGALAVTKVSDHLTHLAEVIIQEVVNIAWHQMVHRYGYPAGTSEENKQFAVIAYGKLGGIELGYGSDLDVVFIHECDIKGATDGNKSIDSRQFYIKLAQRIQHIFTTNMQTGMLYELDTRLRPSGASGLLAIHIDTFQQYQLEDAWTWEHQALVRSRIVFGQPSITEKFYNIKQQIIAQSREQAVLREQVVEMREKMRNHLSKSAQDQADLKQDRGGIADIEFIAQYLVLLHAEKHSVLAEHSDTLRIFKELEKLSLISGAQATALKEGYCLLRDEGHHLSLKGLPLVSNKVKIKSCMQACAEIWHEIMA